MFWIFNKTARENKKKARKIKKKIKKALKKAKKAWKKNKKEACITGNKIKCWKEVKGEIRYFENITALQQMVAEEKGKQKEK